MFRNVVKKVITKRNPNSGLLVPKRFNQSAQAQGDKENFVAVLEQWET